MASFFGEVLPVFSRAGSDDESGDDEESEEEDSRVVMSWSDGAIPSSCCTLILATGEHALGFVQVFVLGLGGQSWVQRGSLHPQGTTPAPPAPPGEKWGVQTCRVYQHRDSPEVWVALCAYTIPEELLHDWAKQLVTLADPVRGRVLVLSGLRASELLVAPLGRTLSSAPWKDPLAWPLLPPPMHATGLPAAVVSEAVLRAVPVALYLLYSEAPAPDLPSTRAFLPVLSLPPLTGLTPLSAPSLPQLQMLMKPPALPSNIYT
ncbi:proteasome assembly chaperone 1 [Petromyzon marinus]|uniref:Proteasome assembly chaperone 1 n=1 Tax=Petromyzon marinus TaxID=7757 RepID=A0AAJ7XIT7_PETMA|nr:proteasome assembly chaperone 1 [Petromyzon marinus]XP_032835907.1 proteasome assembly chaperone 1 [Petromyzon marinus]XP_032835908.1 proteasome assembly chaperone 1 [Petromyzon marinus]XP_032835909.1 proteasome assembly chaperone 1 [Petromyzon marinus]XP_032835910.1 proteasome assembly chaperone 1 [Petromyzon marinus]